MARNRSRTFRGRLLRGVAALAVLAIGTIAALPWLLSTAPAKRWLVGRINGSLGTGEVEVAAISVSWRGPIRVSGLRIKGRDGKPLVIAPKATIDRGLWDLMRDRTRLGTILVDGPTLDLERRGDGSLDLSEALGLARDPKDPPPAAAPDHANATRGPDLTLKVVNGSLTFRSPELGEPFTADRLDATARVPGDGSAVTWKVALASKAGEALDLDGSLDRGSSRLSLQIAARRWPAHLLGGGVVLKGRLDGKLAIDREGDVLGLTGDARLLDVDASGPALAGDRLVMDAFGGTWDVARGLAGWSIRTLDLTGPIATLRSTGAVPAVTGHPATITATVDLAALSSQAPRALKLREGLSLSKGTVGVRVEVSEEGGAQRLGATARLSDIEARDPGRPAPIVLREPATVSASIVARGRDVRVEAIRVDSGWLAAHGAGALDTGIKFDATYDLAGLRRQLGDLIDLGAIDLAGRGTVAGEYRRERGRYAAHVSGDVREFAAAGLTTDPIRRKRVTIAADLVGPADVTGVPLGWASAKVGLGAEDFAVWTIASPQGEGLSLAVAASLPMGGGGKVEANLASVWANSALAVSSARVDWKPADPASALSLAFAGRLDAKNGTAVLVPLASDTSSLFALAPGGFRVAGLNGPGMAFEGGFSGDLGAIDRAWASWSGSTPYGWDGPTTIGIKGGYHKGADLFNVAELAATSRYGSAGIQGTVTEFSGRRVADIRGALTIAPGMIDEFVAAHVAADARAVGRARPIRVVGPLASGHWPELRADAGLDLDHAEAYGLRLGAATVQAHLAGGRIAFDPIRSTLNGGRVELRPLVTFEDAGGGTLRLQEGSAVEDAAIDDEMSRRILSYAAPILRDATRVGGHLSASLAHAEFPFGGDGSRRMGLEGQVVMKDLRFGPGPLAREVLDLAAGGREPEARINETIAVAVSNGRVFQKGLAVDLGGGRKVTIDGSVGFDSTLALRAEIPLAALPGLRSDVGETRLPIAIGGTFSKPTVDRRAMARALKNEGRSAIRREAQGEVENLLKRLEAGPRRRQ